jgi:DNA-binding NarL/FixJ family response regulator
MTNVFVIDDHPMFIDGLKSVFANNKDGIKISGSANSADEALPLLIRSKAKIVLLDLKMPGTSGDEFCLVLKRKFPDKKVIALTGETDTTLLYNTWNNMVDAILIKHCGKQELVNVITSVLSGKRILGTNVPEFLIQRNINKSDRPRLTNSELRVITLLSTGKSRPEVGQVLGTSQHAVNFHVKNIFKKFKMNKIMSVVDEAKRLQLIT